MSELPPTEKPFEFQEPGELKDGELLLVLTENNPAQPERQSVPNYRFEMRNAETGESMGFINLRVGFNERIKYGGHIGYAVDEKFRGHRYAARSCKLIFEFAKKHGLHELWATCNPDNIASRKTIESVGGTLVEIVDLPETNEMYALGDRQKCRYRFEF